VVRERSAPNGLLLHWRLPRQRRQEPSGVSGTGGGADDAEPSWFQLQLQQDVVDAPPKILMIPASQARLAAQQALARQSNAASRFVKSTAKAGSKTRKKKGKSRQAAQRVPGPGRAGAVNGQQLTVNGRAGAADPSSDEAAHELLLGGLAPHSWYTLRMREVYADGQRTGRWSAIVRGQTLPPPPLRPRLLQAKQLSTEIAVRWMAGGRGGEPERCSYHVECWLADPPSSSSSRSRSSSSRRKRRPDAWEEHKAEAGRLPANASAEGVVSCVLTGLQPGTRYHVRVVAVHAGGRALSRTLLRRTAPHEAVPSVGAVGAVSGADGGECHRPNGRSQR
jgi:hypothetical protein